MSTIALVRRKASLRNVLVALAALAAGLSVFSYLSWLRAQVPVAGKLVALVVARANLDPGTTLEPDMLTMKDHPNKYLPAGAVLSTSAAVGRVLTVPIFAGEAITTQKLGSKGGVSSMVPPGLRAYSLAVSSGLGFVPRPGDRVDVIATLPREVLGEPTSISVLRNKEVAQVGISENPSLGKVGDQLGIEEQTAGLAMTLFVTPAEAQHLAIAESLGRITVVLAPSAEKDRGPPPPVKPGDLGR